jgi:hypothetical protein
MWPRTFRHPLVFRVRERYAKIIDEEHLMERLDQQNNLRKDVLARAPKRL